MKLNEKLKKLLNYSFSVGASKAKIIETNCIVVENRVVLKCKYWCENYNKNWSCPPFTPKPKEFKEILSEYNYAIILKFDSLADPNMQLKKFYEVWNKDKIRVLEAVLEIERQAFKMGFPFALALRAGSCNLCSKCDVSKPCKHPEKLRFSPEAVGVNIWKTLENVNLNIKPVWCGGRVDLIAMVLIT